MIDRKKSRSSPLRLFLAYPCHGVSSVISNNAAPLAFGGDRYAVHISARGDKPDAPNVVRCQRHNL
jgi:hypothetical protein